MTDYRLQHSTIEELYCSMFSAAMLRALRQQPTKTGITELSRGRVEILLIVMQMLERFNTSHTHRQPITINYLAI